MIDMFWLPRALTSASRAESVGPSRTGAPKAPPADAGIHPGPRNRTLVGKGSSDIVALLRCGRFMFDGLNLEEMRGAF